MILMNMQALLRPHILEAELIYIPGRHNLNICTDVYIFSKEACILFLIVRTSNRTSEPDNTSPTVVVTIKTETERIGFPTFKFDLIFTRQSDKGRFCYF